jgi:hypothetical protein
MKKLTLAAFAALAFAAMAEDTAIGTIVLEENFADYANISNGVITIQGTTITPLTTHISNSGLNNSLVNDTSAGTATVTINGDAATVYTTTGEGVSNDTSAGTATVSIGSNSATVYTKSKTDTLLAGKAGTATTISGYGITDAKIETVNTSDKKITLGSSSITWYDWALQATKPSYTWNEIGSTPTTIAGYGITDAYITNGVITIGSASITPLTSHQSLSGYVPTSRKVNGKALSSNITLYGSDVAMTSSDATKVDAAVNAKVPLANLKVNGTALTSATTVELGTAYILYTTTGGKTTAVLYAR